MTGVVSHVKGHKYAHLTLLRIINRYHKCIDYHIILWISLPIIGATRGSTFYEALYEFTIPFNYFCNCVLSHKLPDDSEHSISLFV